MLIGIVILFLGLLVLVSSIWLLVEAFRVSLLWGLASLFIPFAQIVFVAKHWERAAKPFLLSYGSASLLWIILVALASTMAPDPAPSLSPQRQPRVVAGGRYQPDQGGGPASQEMASPERVQELVEEYERTHPRREDGTRRRLGEEEPREPSDREIVDSVEEVYRKAAEGETTNERIRAVQDWRLRQLDQLPNARLRMVRALAKGAAEEQAELVVESLTERPPHLSEGLACLEVEGAPATIRRALIEWLRDAEIDRGRADRVARTLEPLVDTEDLLIEEVLVRYGRPRAGVCRRLVEARGEAWARSEAGEALLRAVLDQRLREVDSLLTAEGAELRVLGCELLAKTRGREVEVALELLLPRLHDDAPEVRRAAAGSLAALRRPQASWGLARQLLRERDRATRGSLREALQALPARKTLAYLRQLHRQARARDRLAAQHAGRALDTPEAMSLLTAGLEDTSRVVQVDALKGLLRRVKDPRLRPPIAARHDVVRGLARRQGDAEVQELAFDLDRALLLGE